MGKYRYGVILDAGSSGTRVYIYRWLNAQVARTTGDATALHSLPQIKMLKEKKVHPGISTYGDTPERVGEGLEKLVEYAIKHVPAKEVENTPIFLLATAGVRLLPQYQREALLSSTCNYFQQNTKFQLPDCGLYVQVIPGETEGLYGWIAANYLLGGFDSPNNHNHGGDHHTYGFLDMGGASAQIAFAPNATESEKHAQDLKMLRLRQVSGDPLEYRVFVTTWLGFGANEARRRYVEALLQASPDAKELPDPCIPIGLTITKSGGHPSEDATDETVLIGTGDFAECLKRTNPLLGKDVACTDPPCLLNGIHTPAIDFSINHFVGVSEFWHTTHEIFAMAHKDKAYDFATYQKQVTDFCSQKWDTIQEGVVGHKWGDKVNEKTVTEVCFKASWLISVLHDGIGVPRIGIEHVEPSHPTNNKTTEIIGNAKDRGFLDPFQAVDKIGGEEVSWTLGKMVLYAASQIPPTPATDTLFVGFGSNQPGELMPTDFERPGGSWSTISDSTDEKDWHDKILSSNFSRRVPGIVIFLLIIALAVYLLCGRERRLALQHKILGLLPGSPRSGSRGKRRKAFFSSTNEPSYERVLEDNDPDDFELNDVSPTRSHSPSNLSQPTSQPNQTLQPVDTTLSERPRTGRTSGWATPLRGASPDLPRSSPKGKTTYFDSTHNGSGTDLSQFHGSTSSTNLFAAYSANHLHHNQNSSTHMTYSSQGGIYKSNSGLNLVNTNMNMNMMSLGLTPFERGGLMARTESRERLAPTDARFDGRNRSRMGSRMGSPTRKSPLMTPLAMGKASID